MNPIQSRLLSFFALSVLLSLSSCVLPAPITKTTTDALLALYRDDHFRPLVVEYYSELTRDRSVALAILETCDQLELDPSLAFAIAWNESHFDPLAVSYNPTTVDQGLFQLNSRTFSRLDRKTVFNAKANALHGLTFYKAAYDKLQSESKALGYYNSGIGMTTNRPLPQRTVGYIKRVLADRDRLDHDAIAWLYFSHDTRLALR